MRVAIIGYGYWGPNVARTLAQLLGPQHVIVCERRPDRLLQAARDLPHVEQTARWSDLLPRADVSAVALCTPATTHYALASQALAAGKHVLAEKPAVVSTQEALALTDSAEQQQRVLMAGHVFRYLPAARALRSLIADGTLGELRYFHSDRTSLGPRAREDVSVVWDYLIHDAYLLPWLIDRPVRLVQAVGGSYLRPEVQDVVFAHWEFGAGIIGCSRASWCDPEKVRRLVVVGSRAIAVLNDLQPTARLTLFHRGYERHEGVDDFGNQGLRLFDEGGEVVETGDEPPLAEACRAFLAAVREGRAPAQTRDEIITTTAVCEAVERSLRTGRGEAVQSDVSVRSVA